MFFFFLFLFLFLPNLRLQLIHAPCICSFLGLYVFFFSLLVHTWLLVPSSDECLVFISPVFPEWIYVNLSIHFHVQHSFFRAPEAPIYDRDHILDTGWLLSFFLSAVLFIFSIFSFV